MKKRVGVTEFGLKSLIWQNLPFEKAVMELVDNSLAASISGEMASVCVSVDEVSEDRLVVVVADWGNGMNEEEVVNALQLGSSHKGKNPLNEHGMGLKNALSVLSMGCNPWVLATKKKDEDGYRVVRGPLSLKVNLRKEKEITEWERMMRGQRVKALGAPSTVIAVEVNRSFASTVTNPGGRVDEEVSVNDIRVSLMDCLGVHYRGFLTSAAVTNRPKAEIFMLHTRLDNKGRKSMDFSITPENVPFESYAVYEEFAVMLKDGRNVRCHLSIGRISKSKAATLIAGLKRSKRFYLGSQKTQGVDIRLGDRVIKTGEFERIWKNTPHPSYNHLVGEVHILDAKPGDFSTCNNKGDINLKDENWERLFAAIRKLYTPRKAVGRNISEVACERYVELVQTVSIQKMMPPVRRRMVPFAGSEVSLLLSSKTGEVQFCNFQGSGNPMVHIANTRQQWDGLVLEGLQPTVAKVYAKNVTSSHRELVRQLCETMQGAKDPLTGEACRYNIELHDISELVGR